MQDLLRGEIRLWPQLATVYHFSLNGFHSSGAWPSWARWGWCMPNEIVDVINRSYRFDWDIQEFFRRFAFSREALAETGRKFPLSLLIVQDKFYAVIRDYR